VGQASHVQLWRVVLLLDGLCAHYNLGTDMQTTAIQQQTSIGAHNVCSLPRHKKTSSIDRELVPCESLRAGLPAHDKATASNLAPAAGRSCQSNRRISLLDYVRSEIVNLYELWRITDLVVKRYAQRIRQAQDLDAANEFFNYLAQSGILTLLEENSCEAPLKIDGAGVRKQVSDAQYQLRQRWAKNDMRPMANPTDLDDISQKLALLIGKVEKMEKSGEFRELA